MKIALTKHEQILIITALQETETLIGTALANKILAQDPANDGPEVEILRTVPDRWPGEGWDQ